MTIQEHKKYWIKSAEYDLDVAENLFLNKKYDWSLFLGHLVLEKVFKALYVQNNNNKIPPKMHNLIRLAEISSLNLDQKKKIFFDEVNNFHLETRYPGIS